MKFKVGSLIWDKDSWRWGIIAEYMGLAGYNQHYYNTVWSEGKNTLMTEEELSYHHYYDIYEV